MKRIAHITPTLPPTINGLGDFCDVMVKNLHQKGFDNNTIFVKSFQEDKSAREDVVIFEPSNLYDNLLKVDPDVIILHYVGYAYHPKGIPFSLVRTLKRFKKRSGCKLLIFFHELFSSSNNPFSSVFYTNWFQKRIVKALNLIADATFTNTEIYHSILQELVLQSQFKNVYTGIYSNIPDDLFEKNVEKESGTMVVFGSLKRRKAVIEHPEFSKLLEKLKINRIFDIGPGKVFFKHSDVNLEAKGALSSVEVAFFLNKAKYGSLNYSPELLGKSGIFSAYAAFGVIPVNMRKNNIQLYDNLVEGKNYFNLDTSLAALNENYQFAKSEISSWYSKRNQQAVTDVIIKYI